MNTFVQAEPQIVAKTTEPPVLSEVERLVFVFWSPAKTFTDIRRKPRWWAPFLLVSICSILYICLVASHIGWKEISLNNLSRANPEEMQHLDSLSPKGRQQSVDIIVKVTKGGCFAFPILLLIATGRSAFILLIVLGLFVGQQIDFRRLMAIHMYASLTGLVKVAIVLAVVYAGMDPNAFIISNPIATNVGFFLASSDLPRYVLSVLSQIDLFAIWDVALVGIGIACVIKIKRSAAMATAFGCWLGWVLLIATVPGF